MNVRFTTFHVIAWRISLALLAITGATSTVAADNLAAWPDSVFAPYIDMAWGDNPDLVKIAKAGGGYQHFVLAFVNTAKNKPVWGNHAGYSVGGSDAWSKRIQELRAVGGDVMVSFGGELGANTEPAIVFENELELQKAYQHVIDTYDLAYVDFDIEGAMVRGPSVARRSRVMKHLQATAKHNKKSLKIWITLPATPNGLDVDGKNIVDCALRAGVELEGVNIMTMAFDSGPAKASQITSAGEALANQLRSLYTARSIQRTDAQLAKMIGVTPALNEMDEGELRKVVTWAMERKIGRLSFWEAYPGHNLNAAKTTRSSKICLPFTNP